MTWWVNASGDIDAVVDGCPVRIRRPGGMVVEIADDADPALVAAFLDKHPEATRLDPPKDQ